MFTWKFCYKLPDGCTFYHWHILLESWAWSWTSRCPNVGHSRTTPSRVPCVSGNHCRAAWHQLHPHFRSSFCTDILVPKNYKAKKQKAAQNTALVYFSGPWKFFWYYGSTLKLYYFKLLIRQPNLILHNQFNIPFANYQRPPSEALKLLLFVVLRCR